MGEVSIGGIVYVGFDFRTQKIYTKYPQPWYILEC
jgi:hypothetical protein